MKIFTKRPGVKVDDTKCFMKMYPTYQWIAFGVIPVSPHCKFINNKGSKTASTIWFRNFSAAHNMSSLHCDLYNKRKK